MLIIFDLDDTLVDTTGCLTHFLLEDALSRMCNKGLAVVSYEKALEALRALNLCRLSAREALEEFVSQHSGSREILETGMAALYDLQKVPCELKPLKGAQEVVKELSSAHTVCLVTIGKPLLQMDKLEKAGIDSACFSKILISEEPNKGDLYQSLLSEFEYVGKDVIVCGDRIARDLSPAKKHGCQTVLMRWGRGLQAKLPHLDVDREITSLSELLVT